MQKLSQKRSHSWDLNSHLHCYKGHALLSLLYCLTCIIIYIHIYLHFLDELLNIDTSLHFNMDIESAFCKRNPFLEISDYYQHISPDSRTLCVSTKGISIHDIKILESLRLQIQNIVRSVRGNQIEKKSGLSKERCYSKRLLQGEEGTIGTRRMLWW